jgi:pantetheine-phosphate adenylyltransferase
MKTAIYPGTFDPLTLGHFDIIQRSHEFFDQLIIAVAVGHHKKALLDLAERVALVKEAVKPFKNVSVISFEGLLAEVVRAHKADLLLRGARNSADFDQELQLALANKQLSDIDTLFLSPSLNTQFISSTLVREIFVLKGDISPFVPANVVKYLTSKR